MEMPEGIDIVPEAVPHGDFSYNGRQLNVVWLTIPAEGIAAFSFLAGLDRAMNGSFSLGGRLIQITGGKNRHNYYMDSLTVIVTGTSGSAAGEIPQKPTGRIAATEPTDTNRTESIQKVANQQVEFRIQLAVSSKPLTPAQVEEKLGIKAGEPVKTIRSGNIYKYQAGSFTNYSDALAALKKYNASGIKDAFIVAWIGDKQVPVDDNLRKRQP
ncbi:MAG: SPOR domain-containing protein [Bacteroidales bacterium]|nr:SPOR domain-containing protein [Bacteroidales bacterium]